MDTLERRIFVFGEYELDEHLMELRKNGQILDLETKPFFLLLHLVRNAPRVVSRDELLQGVWSGVRVTEASVKTAVHEVRRALGDSASEQRFVATLRGKGYRFCAAVEVHEGLGTGTSPSYSASSELGAELPGGPADSIFVDRQSEMQVLRRALAAALRGERRIVLLHGPPGIGKTRTALECARQAERQGFEVHVGRTHEGEGAPPFWPWRQILRSLGDVRPPGELCEGPVFSASEVLQIAPELSRHLGDVGENRALDRTESRLRQLDGVTRLLLAAARRRPLLLVLDDLHWADEASLALLGFVARNLQRARLVILATHRDLEDPFGGERALAIHRVKREPGAESLVLQGLGRESVEQTLRSTLRCSVSPALVDEIVRATGGNPFFVAELVRLLNELDTELDLDGERLPIPGRMLDTVLIRISERSDHCQVVLRCASAIGPCFSLALLRNMVDLGIEDLLEALQEARHTDFVRRDATSGTYSFVHGVMQEVLYEQLPDAMRMRLHARIADTLEKLGGAASASHASELAHHFTEAAPLIGPERAIDYRRSAALRAREVFAFPEAVDHYRQALLLLALLDAPGAELRCTLLVELGEALGSAEAPLEQVQEVLFEAIDLARELSRPKLLARAAVASTEYTRLNGITASIFGSPAAGAQRERHAAVLREALESQALAHDAVLRGRVLLALSGIAQDAGNFARAAPLVNEARTLAEGSGDAELRARALLEQFPLLANEPRIEGRLELARELLALSRESGSVDLESIGHSGHVFLALVQGDRAALERAISAIERLSRSTELPSIRWMACTCRSLRAQLDGRLDDADREMREGATLRAVRNMSPWSSSAILAFQSWWSAVLRGHATQLLPTAEAYASTYPHASLASLFLAHLRLEGGRRDDVRREPIGYVELLNELPRDDGWLCAAGLSAELCAVLGDRVRAEPLFELLLPYADRGVVFCWMVLCTGSLARPVGSLAALLERWQQCEELFERALAYCESLSAPTLRVWTQIDYANALLHHPQERMRRSREILIDEALRTARQLGLGGAMRRVQRS